jgi:hypothetical protein
MKSYILIVAVLLLSKVSFGQEQKINSERSLQLEPNSSLQSDTIRTDIKTERVLQTKKETKKQEKGVKIKSERAIRNEE